MRGAAASPCAAASRARVRRPRGTRRSRRQSGSCGRSARSSPRGGSARTRARPVRRGTSSSQSQSRPANLSSPLPANTRATGSCSARSRCTPKCSLSREGEVAARAVVDRREQRRRVRAVGGHRRGRQAAGMAVRAAGGEHDHAGGERRHGLVKQLLGVHVHSSMRTAPSPPTTACRASSAGSGSGKSVRWWAPRLSSRARQDAATSRATGNGSPASSRSPSADRRSPAWRHSAARVVGRGRRGQRGVAGGARLVRPRLVRCASRPRGRRARSTPPASSTPAGWRRAGRCTRTRPPRRGPATEALPSRSVATPPIV